MHSHASASFCERHFRMLVVLVLGLAAFNLGFRLNREVVTAWDESLYATSAAEMLRSGQWVVTTFQGNVDYYNSKPPLNVWLIALSFKLFGVSLWSLRLPSVVAAWLTMALLLWWCRRCFGALTALLSVVVLSTTFAFIYLHSARSGNADALFTLTVVLTVLTLWSAADSPTRLVWLGPIAAAAFLLKGTAVMIPLTIAAIVLVLRGVSRTGVAALSRAAVLFAIPTGAWAIARWRFDRWRFFDAMINYDLVARATTQLEGHDHGWFYYLHVLQKDHYDWLAIAVLLLIVVAATHREHVVVPRGLDRQVGTLLGAWGAVTLLVPTLMATKLAWYVDPFYPLLAVLVALIITSAFNTFPAARQVRERGLVTAMVVLAFGVAEGKQVWYSYTRRDLGKSVQGFFVDSQALLRGRRVLAQQWDPADHFVLTHIAGATPVTGHPGQLARDAGEHDLLVLESSGNGGWTLSRARDVNQSVIPPTELP